MNPEEMLEMRRRALGGKSIKGVRAMDYPKMDLYFGPTAKLIEAGEKENEIKDRLVKNAKFDQRTVEVFYDIVSMAVEKSKGAGEKK